MKRYKILNVIFNIAAICLFVAGIITFSSKSDTAVGIVFICCGFIFLNSANIFLRKQNEDPEKPQAPAEESPTEDAEKVTVHATVTDMFCSAEMSPEEGHGYWMPKSVRHFAILFRTDDGQELELEVDEEMYQGFDKGMTGTLTYFYEQVFSFEPDAEQQ